MSFHNYWYVVCESRELNEGNILSRQILDEWLVIYRDQNGQATVLRDKCAHRSGRLSKGKVKDGRLVCNYHGWHYGESGQVVKIPSDSPEEVVTRRCAKTYLVKETDGYIYTCLGEPAVSPFSMLCHKKKGYHTIRLQHRFSNTVTNCVENFVDIPHTTYVHPTIFRYDRRQKLSAKIERKEGSVHVSYGRETGNFGVFSKFLNPSGSEICHTDEFHVPNITCVQYQFSGGKHFIITSQSIPITDDQTLVYTDLTFNYGVWNYIAYPLIYLQAKAIIRQDVVILRQQMEVIKKYGEEFQNSRSDVIHTLIESIRGEVAEGRNPIDLPVKKVEVDFWI